MRTLFDQGTPAPLRHSLASHEVVTAFEQGWQTLQNGDLLLAAEAAGFEVFVTTDKNLQYQQNLSGRQMAIIVLPTTNWRLIKQHADLVVRAIETATQGGYVGISFPPS